MTAKNIGDYVIPSDWGDEGERLRLLGEWRDSVVQGGTDLARWYAMTITAVRAELLAGGAISDQELDEVIAALGRPELLEPGWTFVGVWGRKPQ